MVLPRFVRWLWLLPLLGTACGTSFNVDGERALARVVHQVDAGPRIPGQPGHEAIRRWLRTEIERLGGRVEEQAFVDSSLGRPLSLDNIIGHFGPSGGRPLVLCAHWDTRPFSDEDPDSARRGEPVPGANDGASGVAVLLEVAELMKRRPPPVGVDLVFFDGEDQGRSDRPDQFSIGARAYAARFRGVPAAQKPAAAFLFDMVGDRDLDIYPEVQSATNAANLVAIVHEAARATGARHFHDGPRYAITDDHVPLLQAGIPAVDIIDFDYAAWHTPRDLPDQVSAASLAEVARVAAWIVYRGPFSAP